MKGLRYRGAARGIAAALLLSLGLIAAQPGIPGAVASGTGHGAGTIGSNVPFFAYYYMWWDANHWQLKLGSSYPYSTTPLPLPATLGSDGCSGQPLYSGDTLLDVPTPSMGLYSQDDPATLDTQIQTAAGAGLQGFVVSWGGTGQPGQTPASMLYNKRLDLLVSRVNAFNSTHANRFHLILGYEGTDNTGAVRPSTDVQNDWACFVGQYRTNPAFQVPQFGSKPVLLFIDSRLYSVAAISRIVTPFRSYLTVIADEHGLSSWDRGIAPYFDGASWYWAAQDPVLNPQSAQQLGQLAAAVEAEGKLWLSPLSGGYDKNWFTGSGTCVPRRNGQTMQLNYAGNKASHPAGWFYISWDEYFENTYVEPSSRYGSTYLDTLKNIIANP